MRSNLSRVLIIGAAMGLAGRIGDLMDMDRATSYDARGNVRRRPASARTHRPGNYRGQSPEAAQAALDAAEAKRARRIARNKRIAGEAV